MSKRYLFGFLLTLCVCSSAWGASDLAPALPDLNLPAESQQPVAVETASVAPAKTAPAVAVQKKTAARKSTAKKKTVKKAAAPKQAMPPVTNAVNKVNTEEVVVENLIPQQQMQPLTPAAPVPGVVAAEQTPAQGEALAAAPVSPVSVQAPQNMPQQPAVTPAAPTKLVQYNPPTDRDPTLSPDDTLLLKHREEERLRALEAERQRKLAEERRRLAELERQRQLELERLRDPSREVRGKIRVSGIIGQEVFIGNRIYTVGKSVYGARIVRVLPDSVVFTYKGQQFTKKVDLK